uniref:Ribosomal protein L6 n=1 Tax=Paramoeba aparasomata TaxID=2583407 RepID=A0A5P8HBK6_9EUKA|nr:ribosomal protein L6 [Paramoeba aparasomata]
MKNILIKYGYKLFKRSNLLMISYNKYFLILKNMLDNSYFLIHNDLYLNMVLYKNSYFYFFNHSYYRKFKLNMVKYIKNLLRGFSIIIDIIGLGYYITKTNILKNLIRLSVGHNHCIYYYLPKGIFFRTKRRQIFLFSFSYFLLKNVSVDIINFRRISVYKLKGIKLKDALYKKKNWKKGVN